MLGHNRQDDTLFSNLKDIKIGDSFQITSLNNSISNYVVFDIFYALPDDGYSVIKQEYVNTKEVTLVCCSDDNDMRLVVKAK